VLKEYPGDGLHVDTLLDSDSHGALTYILTKHPMPGRLFVRLERTTHEIVFIALLIEPGKIRKSLVLDYTKALEVLKEYPGDGLHVDTLLDSDSHGALTGRLFVRLERTTHEIVFIALLIEPGKIRKSL
jgi:hypothetical protein